ARRSAARLRARAPPAPGRAARARGSSAVRGGAPGRAARIRARRRAPSGAVRPPDRAERRRSAARPARAQSGLGAERGPRRVNRAAVSAELASYAATHPEDAAALARFARLLEDTPAPFSRDQYLPGHLTCSACVLDASATRVLLLHHARLGRWLQPGGHAEPGDASPLAGALRELREEAGLADPAPLCDAGGSALVDLDVHEIPPPGPDPAPP